MTPREGVEPVAWAIRRDLPISGKGRFIAISNEPYDPSSIDDAEECVVPLYAHPAATARWEAWKAMVEALVYIASHRGLTLLGDGSYSDGVRDGWIELADAADRALALARSTGGM